MPERTRAQEVLVVEDNGPVRRFVARALRNAGFVALEAENAAKGLDLLRAHGDSIAVAIIDMVMPGMSGLDLAAEVERAHAGIKVLFTSGHVSSIAIEGVARRFPEQVLTKPFSEKELLARVTALL